MVEHQVCCYTVSYDVYETSVRSSPLGYELVHHRVTQSLTEFNRFEIKRIELRETLCYSVVRTYYYTVTRKHPFHFIGTFVSLLWGIYFLGKTLLFLT